MGEALVGLIAYVAIAVLANEMLKCFGNILVIVMIESGQEEKLRELILGIPTMVI